MNDLPLTELSESELLTRLGRELLGTGIGFAPEDPGRYRRFAERWIDARMNEIRAAICENDGIKAIFEREAQDRLNDLGVVADALSALRGHPPVTLLAVVLLRRGYGVVCGC